MTPEQWVKVNELFHGAIEQPPDARAAWLVAASADDPEVRREVHALIAAHEREPGFLDGAAPAASADASLVMPSLTGRRVGAYHLSREIGRGGMGVVYLAHDTRLGRDVAIKALPRERPVDARRRERLRREARAAAALAHPNIATVYALEEEGDELYLVTEYVRGHTLRDELASGPLAAPLLIATAIEITRAVEAAHAQGIIHRDLKPDNVMRTTTGAIKILDFGLARALVAGDEEETGLTLTRSGMLLGTPAYMAPEQIRGTPVDARADLFAAGVMFYELAAGVHPFDGPAIGLTLHRILTETPPSFATRGLLAPPGFWPIVERCLQKEPDARYADAAALLQDLLRVEAMLSPGRHRGDRLRSNGLATEPDALQPRSHQTDPRRGETTPQDAMLAGGGAALAASQPAVAPRVTPFSQVETESRAASSQWWWRFHQLAVCAFFTLLLVPAWRAWDLIAEPIGRGALRIGTLIVITLGVSLRLHLWFLSRYDPTGLHEQRPRAAPWIRAADAGSSLVLAAGGLAIMPAQPVIGAILLGLGTCYAVVFLMIEPATTRAAFRER